MKSLILNGSTTGFQPAKPVLISENLWESLSISEHLGRRFRFQSFLLFCLVFVCFFFGFGLQLLRPATRSARVTPRLIGHKIKSARNSNKPNSKNTKIRKRKKPKKRERKKEKKMAAQRANNKRNSHVPRPQWSPFSDFVSFFLLFNQLWRICHRIVVGLLSFHRPTWSFVRFSLFLSLH